MITAVASPVTDYAQAVMGGKVLVNRLVRLACQRHLHDLETGHLRGLRFDPELARHGLDFFSYLYLAEGAHAGKPFRLEPHQQFIVGSIFGWVQADGFRRFRKAYIEMAKGNGKTPLAAAIGTYGLVADGEQGAEIYTAGVTRDQANYLLGDAEKMVGASPFLRQRVVRNAHNMSVPATNSYMRAVSSEARTLDQKRVHMALIDEIHEHPTSLVVDKLTAGMKGRRQPLIVEITNSGSDRTSVCWQHHQYSIEILEGTRQNDEWFAYVCGLDPCVTCYAEGKRQPTDGCLECDDWRDEKVWVKANPNLDVSITRRYLQGQVDSALGMPANQNIVKRLNFCIWTEQVTRLIPMDIWDAQPGRTLEAELLGKLCIAGLDLSSKLDFTALVLVFRDQNGGVDLLPYFWLPETRIRKYTELGIPCAMWQQQGFIEEIPGEMIDQRVILQRLEELRRKYQIEEVPYDSWNAAYVEVALQEAGVVAVPITQNFQQLSAPTKEMLSLLATKKFRHGNNPVLRWMATNAASLEDSNGNIRAHKGHSGGNIDGIAATLNAMNRVMVSPSSEPGELLFA